MKKIIFTAIFVAQAIIGFSQKITCDQINSDSVRIRIVTLSQPFPWEKIPVPFIVVQENNYFVFYSKQYGNYCEMEKYMDTHFTEFTPYTDARLVVCGKRTKKKK
jgi:hypothetical protein